MIVKGLFELVYNLLSVILTPFQILPSMNAWVSKFIDLFVGFICDPVQLFLFFVPGWYVKLLIPIVIVIVNMEHIWDGIIWILKKLPFVGIE